MTTTATLSPYQRLLASSPVAWRSWGPAALEQAQRENKPLFLHIGYAACHPCRVMARETLADPEIAALINTHFIPVLVDREERPDLNALYMSAVVALTGRGGWPLNVFLTPEGKPFQGGTYFPPEPRYGLLGFPELLREIIRAWEHDRVRVLEAGDKAASHIREGLDPLQRPASRLDPATLQQALGTLQGDYDRTYGGFHPAPKFPQPLVLRFLLARAQQGDAQAQEMALHTLALMARGGFYDVIGGGFHRYSTDDQWHVPHFEKALPDNALLARAYLDAYRLTGAEAFRRVAESTLDFLLRELSAPQGAFYSGLAAETEGEEGRYYTWTPEEVRAALGEDLAPLFNAAYDITPTGHHHGRSVPHRVLSDAEVAQRFGLADAAAAQAALEAAKARLREVRATRPHPDHTPQAVTAWNAYAIQAFAEAGAFLNRPDYLDVARHTASWLRENLWTDDHLAHLWRDGHALGTGFLEDYAALGNALLSLAQATGETDWLTWAQDLAAVLHQRFADTDRGGYFDTAPEHDTPFGRLQDVQDGATPSGNSLTATFFLRLATLASREDLRQRAEALLRPWQAAMARYPTGFGQWLIALNLALASNATAAPPQRAPQNADGGSQ